MSTEQYAVGEEVRVVEAAYVEEYHGRTGTLEGIAEPDVFRGVPHPFAVRFADGDLIRAAKIAKVIDASHIRGTIFTPDGPHLHFAAGAAADDAYVEPEPLEKGDAVLVWATIQGSEWSDATTPVHLPVPDPDLIFVPTGAIVRPSADHVPPWTKPAVEEPTALGTLVFCDEGSVFVRVDTYGRKPWMRSGFDERRSWDEIPTVERTEGGAS